MLNDEQKQKHQQREAVENFHGNFVEPHLKIIQESVQSFSTSVPHQNYASHSLIAATLIFLIILGIHLHYLCRHRHLMK